MLGNSLFTAERKEMNLPHALGWMTYLSNGVGILVPDTMQDAVIEQYGEGKFVLMSRDEEYSKNLSLADMREKVLASMRQLSVEAKKMAEFEIRFYPVEDVKEDKTEAIQHTLIQYGVLKLDTRSTSGKLFAAGNQIDNYIEGYSAVAKERKMGLVIRETSDTVIEVDQDQQLLTRNNMFEIKDTDGGIGNWDKLCDLLELATGDVYKGNWEFSIVQNSNAAYC